MGSASACAMPLSPTLVDCGSASDAPPTAIPLRRLPRQTVLRWPRHARRWRPGCRSQPVALDGQVADGHFADRRRRFNARIQGRVAQIGPSSPQLRRLDADGGDCPTGAAREPLQLGGEAARGLANTSAAGRSSRNDRLVLTVRRTKAGRRPRDSSPRPGPGPGRPYSMAHVAGQRETAREVPLLCMPCKVMLSR